MAPPHPRGGVFRRLTVKEGSTTSLVIRELRAHAPFTGLGTLLGVMMLIVVVPLDLSRDALSGLFWATHPTHVLFSALVTAGLYRSRRHGSFFKTLMVGYLGSIGIATLSDCIVPFVGEFLLDLPHRDIHLGFIERWWIVNPLALVGIVAGYLQPMTKFPHSIHVLLSTWASLFHMVMAMGDHTSASIVVVLAVFLFLAVWIPCCLSDIVFPLLFKTESAVIQR